VSLNDVLSTLLLTVAAFFYLAGTVGLLRFPDVHSRLHALTKADNLGLMFVCLAMGLQSGSARVTALLAVVWLLALVASAVSAHLVARRALQFDARAPEPALHRAEPPL
jgi:multicomponent Na+:H+ antiporter subunit G